MFDHAAAPAVRASSTAAWLGPGLLELGLGQGIRVGQGRLVRVLGLGLGLGQLGLG